MKILMFVTVSLTVLFFIVALFLPSEYSVERTITINKSADFVYERVADLNYYKKWNV